MEWVYFDLATGNEMSGDYQENEPIYLTEITCLLYTSFKSLVPTGYVECTQVLGKERMMGS